MKKFAKMSLVAAVAVAGLTSANAASLTEAIKNVEVSGMARYRYNDVNNVNTAAGVKSTATAGNNQNNDYDLEVNVKVPVNDMTTLNVKLDAAMDPDDTTGDLVNDVTVEDLYFTFNPGYATIMVGKQNIPGPFTDGAQGTGIVALVPAGPVTIAAGYFNDHSVRVGGGATFRNNLGAVQYVDGTYTDGKNAMEVAVLGSFGPVNAELWYADIDETMTAINAKLAGSFGPVNASLMHTIIEIDDLLQNPVGGAFVTPAWNVDNEASITKLDLSAKFGMFSAKAGYVMTSEFADQGLNRLSIDNDNDAKTEWSIWQVNAQNASDAKGFYLGAGVAVDKFSAGLTYGELEEDAGASLVNILGVNNLVYTGKQESDEILLDVAYQMSSNFKISGKYSQSEFKTTVGFATTKQERDAGRLELLYTF